ncbi:MAG: hypothetical protein ACD_49C00060G0055 [uncultured bacterium (gcode 4)]|uniref:Uncharacterized protein n=1 Tax=uncultured bacterium (gcode 4) TaxID=1234023 RepID=K2BBS4_9BACT|nr:MAG: hypothetical protein ACD_49C00060G0055 [uncultured bacterium (gcode 4)]
MFNNDEEFLSTQDKIDKMYTILKKQHRMNLISSIFSWIFRLAIIYALFTWYQIFVQNKNPELKAKITSSFSSTIVSIVNPIIGEVLKENIGKMNPNSWTNVSPEQIDSILKTLKK